jgi:hypothetical protein
MCESKKLGADLDAKCTSLIAVGQSNNIARKHKTHAALSTHERTPANSQNQNTTNMTLQMPNTMKAPYQKICKRIRQTGEDLRRDCI